MFIPLLVYTTLELYEIIIIVLPILGDTKKEFRV